MKFSSKTPHDLNHDPEPFVWRATKLRTRIKYGNEAIDFEPRPEFDHIQHNEPNPILVELRQAFAADHRRPRMVYIESKLREVEYETRNGNNGWSPQMLDHARRVLTRLARLTEGDNRG